MPYRAALKGDTWIVEGSLPEGIVGGVAVAEITKRDATIRRVSHGKDRKSNATSGSIFDSGSLSQTPISCQEVLGAAIKLPYRSPGTACSTPGTACSRERSRWRRLIRATGTSHP